MGTSHTNYPGNVPTRILHYCNNFAIAQKGDYYLFIKDFSRLSGGGWEFTHAIIAKNPIMIWTTYWGSVNQAVREKIGKMLIEQGCNPDTGEPIPYAPEGYARPERSVK
ncbi:hypothetical protein [Anaeromassilibacillus senegalensis]|uniref:hypothetical protein n=1 Tax=Anaeromassilibacillus senegalensis TaxID=1673717 RepID=UPI000680B0DA|nr:hypothetical protein [Anaeromassilibacillus senegalensis]